MKTRTLATIVASALLLASCGQKNITANQTPQLKESAIIEGEYIVTLKKDKIDGLSAQSLKAENAEGLISSLGLEASGITVQNMYSNLLSGFSGKINDANLARLKSDPRVEAIEPNIIMSIASEGDKLGALATQRGATWGLDRIDQRSLPLNNSYEYPYGGGSGVTAYVVDTGINTRHNEFGSRASWGGNFTGDGKDYDCQGHGTHVAGTIGGKTYGVAKSVSLVAVKVLKCDGKGSNDGIIKSLEWISRQYGKKVVNMSLGPQYRATSNALDSAVNNLVSSGAAVGVAAGNSSDDACYYSPARASSAITVAASNKYDSRASFSNYGSCTDIIAPGERITSAWHTSNSATNTISGTSMATPHVVGVAALQMAKGVSGGSMESRLNREATTGKISSLKGTPNRLLYMGTLNGNGGSQPDPVTPDPVTPKPDPVTPQPDPIGGKTYRVSVRRGASVYYPERGFSFSGGVLSATLTGNASADMDLYLEKLYGSRWYSVKSSLNLRTSNESISYNGTAGTYRWKVRAWSDSGTGTLRQK